MKRYELWNTWPHLRVVGDEHNELAAPDEGVFVRAEDYDTAIIGLASMVSGGNRMVLQRDARIAELEAAIDKLAAGKGRYHTEANFKALIEVRNKSLHK